MELNEQPASQPDALNATYATAPINDHGAPRPPVSPAMCASCGTAVDSNSNGHVALSYVFAIGRVEMRFPTLAIEKEFAQATGRANTRFMQALLR